MSGAVLRHKPVVFLALRWLFAPYLFYCIWSYLEGPPTKVVVQSFAFVVGSFSISILAAQFLCQVRKIPIALSLLQALLIPGGYLYSAQLYSAGDKNQDYSIGLAVFSLLMMLNAAVYLNGLFTLRQKVGAAVNEALEPVHDDDENTLDEGDDDFELKSFEVSLYSRDANGVRGKVVFRKRGRSDFPESIRLDGYSKDIYIDLAAYWDALFADQREEYQTDISTYETIVKFGDTMQLVNNYQIVFKVKFS